jgi:hypothetical protein
MSSTGRTRLPLPGDLDLIRVQLLGGARLRTLVVLLRRMGLE